MNPKLRKKKSELINTQYNIQRSFISIKLTQKFQPRTI